MHQFTGMWFNPNSRGSRLRIWQPWGCKSLHAHHFAHVVQGRDVALKTRTVSVQIRPWATPRVAQCRGVPPKPERLQVQVLPRGPIWNVHRSSGRASVLTSACLRASGASPRHSGLCRRPPTRVVQREPASSYSRRTRSVPGSGALPDARTISSP